MYTGRLTNVCKCGLGSVHICTCTRSNACKQMQAHTTRGELERGWIDRDGEKGGETGRGRGKKDEEEEKRVSRLGEGIEERRGGRGREERRGRGGRGRKGSKEGRKEGKKGGSREDEKNKNKNEVRKEEGTRREGSKKRGGGEEAKTARVESRHLTPAGEVDSLALKEPCVQGAQEERPS